VVRAIRRWRRGGQAARRTEPRRNVNVAVRVRVNGPALKDDFLNRGALNVRGAVWVRRALQTVERRAVVFALNEPFFEKALAVFFTPGVPVRVAYEALFDTDRRPHARCVRRAEARAGEGVVVRRAPRAVPVRRLPAVFFVVRRAFVR
jgi:hypothetical protein